MGVRTTVEKGTRGSLRVTHSRKIGPPKAPTEGELSEAVYIKRTRFIRTWTKAKGIVAFLLSYFKARPKILHDRMAEAKLAQENLRRQFPGAVAIVHDKHGKVWGWPRATYGIPRHADGSYYRTEEFK